MVGLTLIHVSKRGPIYIHWSVTLLNAFYNDYLSGHSDSQTVFFFCDKNKKSVNYECTGNIIRANTFNEAKSNQYQISPFDSCLLGSLTPVSHMWYHFITLRLRQKCWNFADIIFKYISLYENCYTLKQISLKLVPMVHLTISWHWFR